MAGKVNGVSAKKTPNKLELVRRAMDKLGHDAGRQAIHDHIKKEFGLELSLDLISTYRGNIREKAAAKPASGGRAASSPPAAQPTSGGASSNGITKLEAVRKVLADSGLGTMPLQIQEQVKRRYGLDVSADVASNYKKRIVKEAKEAKAEAPKPAAPVASAKKRSARKPAPSRATASKPALSKPVPKSAATGGGAETGGGISLGDIEVTKELLGRVGVEQLKRLIDVLSK
jgi:hypothetical protein